MFNKLADLLYIWDIIYSVRQTSNLNHFATASTSYAPPNAVISEERNQTMCYIQIPFHI
jgi:hypothetical protein